MKEIIPLKKDIVFKSKIGELSNLDLDHDYKVNDNLVNPLGILFLGISKILKYNPPTLNG